MTRISKSKSGSSMRGDSHGGSMVKSQTIQGSNVRSSNVTEEPNHGAMVLLQYVGKMLEKAQASTDQVRDLLVKVTEEVNNPKVCVAFRSVKRGRPTKDQPCASCAVVYEKHTKLPKE